MRTITIEVFRYPELSDRAQEKARTWWLESAHTADWSDSPIDEIKEQAKHLGININKVFFSGFCCPPG